MIIELPLDLCPNRKAATAALITRQHQAIVAARVYLGRTFTFSGTPPDSYVKLATVTKFAFGGKLAKDFVSESNQPQPDNGLFVQLEGVDLILPEVCDFDAIDDALLLFVGEEIMSICGSELTGKGGYELTVLRGRFNTPISEHEKGEEIAIIPREEIKPLRHAWFEAGRVGRFKFTVGAAQVSDMTPVEVEFNGARWVG